MVALKTLIFTILVPGTVTIYIPYLLLSSATAAQRMPLGVFRYFGVILILIGATFYFRCAWDFTFTGRGTPAPIDPPKELVVKGLYRYVRNPMYVGVVTLLVGEAILFGSRALFVYAAAAFVIYHLFVVLYEEPVLRRKFGESYRNYCATVPRWIPSFSN
jgi:protein-S-isoprenylcysteine O-methyltransferase Ste14